MHVLALDTTTREGSLALITDGRVVLERRGNAARPHAERLPADLMTLLTDAGLALEQIDVFAVAAGPGGFTGLRVGIAAVQGLAFVTRKRIVPVSVLEAIACAATGHAAPAVVVGAWLDARRHEVFSALYRIRSDRQGSVDRLETIEPPAVGDPTSVLARWVALGMRPDVIAGDGVAVYPHLALESSKTVVTGPLAGVIGQIAGERAGRGETRAPADVQPIYVRRADAEVARDAQRQSVP